MTLRDKIARALRGAANKVAEAPPAPPPQKPTGPLKANERVLVPVQGGGGEEVGQVEAVVVRVVRSFGTTDARVLVRFEDGQTVLYSEHDIERLPVSTPGPPK
jgi:hypothetical protein